MNSLEDIGHILVIGMGATALLDCWLVLIGRMGIPTLNFAFLGRWVGHVFRGRFLHAAIGRADPIPGERALGWLTHYAIGIAFAAVLVGWQGVGWLRQPTLAPSLLVGVCTVLAPLFVMQPAMGAGFASSKTATPSRNVVRSIINHTVFGFGLYLATLLAAHILR